VWAVPRWQLPRLAPAAASKQHGAETRTLSTRDLDLKSPRPDNLRGVKTLLVGAALSRAPIYKPQNVSASAVHASEGTTVGNGVAVLMSCCVSVSSAAAPLSGMGFAVDATIAVVSMLDGKYSLTPSVLHLASFSLRYAA
jgi:hypothetical protein